MKIKVFEERNFFLFQDIYYWFVQTLTGSQSLPVKNKHQRTDYYSYNAFEYVYDSWLAVLLEKLHKAGLTEKGNFLVGKLTEWMVTTNIAILTAQKERGERNIPSYELDYLKEYKPYFLIEHSDDFKTYIVYLEKDMEDAFRCSIDYYNAFKNMDARAISDELISLFKVEEIDIKEEIDAISKHFEPNIKCIDTFEVMEA